MHGLSSRPGDASSVINSGDRRPSSGWEISRLARGNLPDLTGVGKAEGVSDLSKEYQIPAI